MGGLLFLLLSSALLAGCADSAKYADAPPPTRVGEYADTIHGRIVPDPYRWLEGTDDEVPDWLAAQNEHAAAVVAGSASRREVLRRIVELLRTDIATQPIERGGRYFFMKRAADQDRFAVFMREGLTGIDRKIIDPFEIAGSEPVSIALAGVSADGGLVAYTLGRSGQDEVEIRIFQVDRGHDISYTLPPGLYTSVQVLSDGSGLFYVRLEEGGPRLYHHALDRPALADTVVFGDGYGPETSMAAALTSDEAGLGIVVFHGQTGATTEVFHFRVGGEAVRPIVTGIAASFLPTFAGDRVLLHTDWMAPNGRVISVPLNAPGRTNWVEVVPEGDDRIESVTVAGSRMLVNTMHLAQSRLRVYELDGSEVGSVTLPAIGTVESVAGRWPEPEAFFTFTSFVIPPTVFRYDVGTGDLSTWQEPTVRVPTGIAVSQVLARSADGTDIPMFVVHREGLVMDGTHPLMLTAFGALGISLTPGFTAEAAIVAEQGGIFAVANVRGGGELGERWHEAGSGAARPNSVSDFIAAAEWLVQEGYTSSDRLVANGSTHGGFLVTAAMVRRPDLFGAVIADHPVTDLLRLRDWPATAAWASEYGSFADRAGIDAMLRLSPYQAVDAGTEYPAVLVISGGDSPVPAFHARKLAAALQATVSTKPVLLRDITASPAFDASRSLPIEYLADAISFYLFMTVGLTRLR